MPTLQSPGYDIESAGLSAALARRCTSGLWPGRLARTAYIVLLWVGTTGNFKRWHRSERPALSGRRLKKQTQRFCIPGGCGATGISRNTAACRQEWMRLHWRRVRGFIYIYIYIYMPAGQREWRRLHITETICRGWQVHAFCRAGQLASVLEWRRLHGRRVLGGWECMLSAANWH